MVKRSLHGDSLLRDVAQCDTWEPRFGRWTPIAPKQTVLIFSPCLPAP